MKQKERRSFITHGTLINKTLDKSNHRPCELVEQDKKRPWWLSREERQRRGDPVTLHLDPDDAEDVVSLARLYEGRPGAWLRVDSMIRPVLPVILRAPM